MSGQGVTPAAHHRRSAALGPGSAGQVARRRRCRDPDQTQLPGRPRVRAVRLLRRERLRQGLPALLRRLPGPRPGPAAGGLPGPGDASAAGVRARPPGDPRARHRPAGPGRGWLAVAIVCVSIVLLVSLWGLLRPAPAPGQPQPAFVTPPARPSGPGPGAR